MDFLQQVNYQSLLTAGVVGVIAWWLYNKFSKLVFGIKLSPQDLLQSVFGFENPRVNDALHLLIGVVLYPLMFLFLQNFLQGNFALFDYINVNDAMQFGLMMGVLTWFLAVGVFTPLANRPFMLNFKPIAGSSLLGHVVYALAVMQGFQMQFPTLGF